MFFPRRKQIQYLDLLKYDNFYLSVSIERIRTKNHVRLRFFSREKLN